METVEKANAKLNLSLDILGLRPDGYHELSMVMASVDLHDEVRISLRADGEIRLRCEGIDLPTDGRNLAVRAAEAFFDAAGCRAGVDIFLRKRIPVGSGMAGGSSDAAATLRALDRLTGAGLTRERLCEIGLTVGSDVPYCIGGGVALAGGRGEKLTPQPDLPPCSIVICKPPFPISTAELFRASDRTTLTKHPDTAGLLQALRKQDLSGAARKLYNVFEDVLPETCREVYSIRSRLMGYGALGAIMTGTGSAVFGIFDSEEKARTAREILGREYSECFLTSPVPPVFPRKAEETP